MYLHYHQCMSLQVLLEMVLTSCIVIVFSYSLVQCRRSHFAGVIQCDTSELL